MIHIYYTRFENSSGKKKRELEHALGRRLLAACLGEQYGIHSFTVESEPGGKPYLADYPELFFNITHTAELAACAVGRMPLGLDAETQRPWRERAARKALTAREQEQLFGNCGDDESRSAAFIRYWTLKESYVKALGCGLRIPLTEAEFSWSGDCFSGEISCSQPGFRFWQRALPGGAVLALCLAAETEQEVCLTEKVWDRQETERAAGLTEKAWGR